MAYGLSMLGTGATPQPNGPLSGWVVIAVLGRFLLLVAIITVVSTLRRSELAPARLPMMAITLVLLAGPDITGLWSSQLPFAGPAVLDRGLLVVSYGVALALLVSFLGLGLLWRTSRLRGGAAGRALPWPVQRAVDGRGLQWGSLRGLRAVLGGARSAVAAVRPGMAAAQPAAHDPCPARRDRPGTG
ncbi:MAG: hypothetical protein GEU83_04505 [Pseudonocardiaceae bacterium]|nr:hypothetical protein [Pseudonocardiaceae bacterium]